MGDEWSGGVGTTGYSGEGSRLIKKSLVLFIVVSCLDHELYQGASWNL